MAHSMLAQLPDFGAYTPLIVVVAVALLTAARYALIAGGAFALVSYFRERLAPLRIQKIPFTQAQIWREVGFSMSTVTIFGVIAGLIFIATGGAGLPRAELPATAGEWLWAFALVPVMLLAHDFYFYWMHRLIHVSWIYPHVHRVHHLSTNPSALASLAFHPIEAVLEAVGVIAIIALIGPPLPTMIVFGLVAFLFNVLGHLGYEIVPHAIRASRIGRWLNSSTGHNLHHRAFRSNFGLYTLIWDRAFGTIDPRYDASLKA
jgi:sterol desaturase/sphingolipid hydroxylase (fatty acid hydroxylase superfamily)